MNLRFQYCQIDKWFTSYFRKWSISCRNLRGKIMKIFPNNCHMCWNKLNNLDKSEISSKLKHEDNAKDFKLELGQTKIYILPLYLIAHEWIDSAENPTVSGTLFPLLSIGWINYFRQALRPDMCRCSKFNIRQFGQKFFTFSWSCKIQPHWRCLWLFH